MRILVGLPIIALSLALTTQSRSQANAPSGPDCSGRWPTNAAFAELKKQGLTNNAKVDFSKTKTTRLASEKIGPDLYRQVYDVQFTEKSGNLVEAIAVHNASSQECSMTSPEIYIVSKHLNRGGQ